MRRFVITLLMILSVASLSAQLYHSVNVDEKTVAAMVTSYEIEEETEKMTATDMDSILGHYTKATLSTAGIYYSKMKDLKAMREVGVFGTDENYYYKRIFYLVKDGIMPKFITVGAKMLKHPDNALYWGPYLFKTTKNVEQLCKQFELVVTNGRLTFKDVVFLGINEGLQKVFDMSQLGNVKWKDVLENVSEFGANAGEGILQADIKELGGILATAGKDVLDSKLKEFSNIGKIFKSKPDEILRMYEDFKNRYGRVRKLSDVTTVLKSVIGNPLNPDAISRLFRETKYSLEGYISNYIQETKDQHYRQRWYIYSENSGKETLAIYQPFAPLNTNNPKHWDKWLFKENYQEKHAPDYPTLTDAEYQQLKKAAEAATGWNEARKAEYEKENPGHTITLKYETLSYTYQKDKKGNWVKHGEYWRGKHWTVSMTVIDSWDIKKEVYEEIFDSESMDEATFKQRMESKLKYYNDLENDKTIVKKVLYHLGFDEKRYYSLADENKMKGCSSVSFLAKCDDGATLAEGSFNWKENGDQGKHLGEKSKEFAMRYTGATSTGSGELQQKKKEFENDAKNLQDQIKMIDQQLRAVIAQINQAKMAKDNKKVESLRNQYDELSNKQEGLKQQLTQANDNLRKIENALDEYFKDLQGSSDSPYRIPSNMRELEALFKLSWEDEGEWVDGGDQYTFVRRAYCAQIKSQVTYTAVLKLQSPPKYFLGIRIHRAILSVDYKLGAGFSSENVVEIMKLDTTMSEKARAEKVNERQKQLMEDMPDCTISLHYNYSSSSMGEAEDPDVIHLLWASDRLDVAREVEFQLSTIYSQLVLLEKVMNERQKIEDFFKFNFLKPLTRRSRGTIAEYALQRWQDASAKAKKSSNTPHLESTTTTRKKKEEQQ